MYPWVRFEHYERYDFVSRLVAGKDVVDCACGAGIGTSLFVRNGAKSVIGIDVDDGALEEAKSRHQAPNLRFLKGDGRHLPLPSSSCDLFISLETIEHVENDAGFLDEIHRVLKPGGRFICSTPNREVANPGTSIADKPWNQFHVREYTLPEFSSLLGKRFDELEFYGQNPVSRSRIGLMSRIARLTWPMLAVRLNQLLKCRWFLHDSSKNHRVAPDDEKSLFEYLIICCRRP